MLNATSDIPGATATLHIVEQPARIVQCLLSQCFGVDRRAIEHRRRKGSGVHEHKPSAKVTCEVVRDLRGAPGAMRVVESAYDAADHQRLPFGLTTTKIFAPNHASLSNS